MSSLAFDDADAFNRFQRGKVLTDDVVFARQPLEDLPQAGKFVALDFRPRGQAFGCERREKLLARRVDFVRQVEFINQLVNELL